MLKVEYPKEYAVPLKLVSGLDWEQVPAGTFPKAWFTASSKYSGVAVHKAGSGRGRRTQFGLSKSPASVGGMSAAQLVALSHPETTFYLVLPVVSRADGPSEYWVVGVDHGEIIPGTDRVGSAEDVLRVIDSTSALMAFDDLIIYAPRNENVFGATDHLDPEDVFEQSLFLKSIRISRLGYRKYIVAAFALFVAISAVNTYNDYVERSEAVVVQQRTPKIGAPKKSLEELQEEALSIERAMIVEMLSRRSEAAVVREIYDSFRELPIALGGWVVTTLKYEPAKSNMESAFQVYLENQGGSVADLIKRFERLGYTVKAANDGKKAIASKELQSAEIDSPGKGDPLESSSAKRIGMVDYLVPIGIDVNVSNGEVVQRPRELPDYLIAPDETFITPISRLQVKISGKGATGILDAIKAISIVRTTFVLTRLSIRPSSDVLWEIEGNIYE